MSNQIFPLTSSFVEYLRPTALREIMDRKAGISPEQRQAMNIEAKVREDKINALAVEACGKLSREEYEALAYYLTRYC